MKNTLQTRYEGFLKTPCLWRGNQVFGLRQFKIESSISKINITIESGLRLGKYIERLVSFELTQQKNIRVLAENIQIRKDKLTLGELDCLLLKNKQPIHLEIIYKFYLYDNSVGTYEIEHFIGPNRKDALIEKLTKLKDKQLPLLHTNTCKPYLDTFDLKAATIKQQVYFKAQLFLPFANQNIQLNTLNDDCVVGFYITKNELAVFRDCKFYIPAKKDWLITPHTNVDWLSFKEITTITKDYFEQKYSALIWVKYKSGLMKKVFLVWW
ncbi:hypothetical protein SAMN05421824_0806 [Hyunsoonleella jejuensis]|uniref:DUF1853 domain-containing protein n=1 Tax=Hyunsoonleella jejuensis TaxID=419940 RepID=A0A1H9C4T5_9FLAO|nr:DUF1853 family protein [Hyunsoonleella jejuensis]SEP96216.1 hypothetical protein SAMN05421824_0806 [Hyunsoonleella jejuensis]